MTKTSRTPTPLIASPKILLALVSASMLLLTACGGGGGGGDSAANNANNDNNTAAQQPSPTAAPNSPAGNDAPAGNDTPADPPPTSNVTVVGNCTLSAEENELITAHNEARAQARQCGSESFAPAPALAWHCLLGEAAENHSTDMATVNFFSHTGSDGLSPFDRMGNLGYSYSTAGENVAAAQQSVSEVMASWLESDGHCANIMKPEFTQMGGSRVNSTTADWPSYWTAAFGAST